MSRLGQYRHRVTIEQKARVHGALGADETWTPVAQRFAIVRKVTPEGQSTYQNAGYSNVEYTVDLRTFYPVTMSDHRFIWNGQVLEILHPPTNPDTVGKDCVVPCRLDYRERVST